MNGKPQPHTKQAARRGISIRVDAVETALGSKIDAHEVTLPEEVFDEWLETFRCRYTDALQYLRDH